MSRKAPAVTNQYSRPSSSPGRALRVVTDTEGVRSGCSATRRWARDVLPAPEGLEMTSIRPRRRSRPLLDGPLFDILHLLAELIDARLQRQADGGERADGGLRTQGVGLAHELLGQEVQPPAAGPR